MIKANKRSFKLIAATNNYIETSTFEKNCFLIHIKTKKNCKMNIATRSTTYTKLVTKFFEDRLWKKSKSMPKLFMELIKSLLAIKLIINNIRNQTNLILQAIAEN